MIEAEAEALLESPCSLIVGTVDGSGQPDATRGWGLEVLGPAEVRLLLASNADTSLVNLRTVGAIAITATHFATLVSVQLKGRVSSVEAPTARDEIRFDEFCAGCVGAIHDLDGTPEDRIWRLVPPGVVTCIVDVDEVFDQTPGPTAGNRLAPEASAP